MAKNTIEIFKETPITYRGVSPDLRIDLINEDENKIDVEVSINIKRHQFDDDCVVSFQPYNNRGAALKPLVMGTVGNLIKKTKIFLNIVLKLIKRMLDLEFWFQKPVSLKSRM